MENKILLVCSNPEQVDTLTTLLSGKYRVDNILDESQLAANLPDTKLMIVDQNINDFHGIDILMNAISTKVFPVLMLTNENNQKAAYEAMNAGAFNFIVKTAGYEQILLFGIDDSITRFNQKHLMQGQISVLKERITILKKQGIAKDPGLATGPTLLELIVNKIKQGDINLPSYSDVASRFKSAVDRGAGIAEVTVLLQNDPAISSKMISVANSTYYRGFNEVKTIEQAIGRIGLAETRNYVELISNRALYAVDNENYKAYLGKVWMHSLGCAYACHEISKTLMILNPAVLFAMGLFHDIGKLLLVQIISELENNDEYQLETPEAEWLELVKLHHGRFGESLMKKWQLATEYSYVCRWHDKPQKADNVTPELLIVGLADQIAQSMGYSDIDEKPLAVENSFQAQSLKLDQYKIEEIKSKVTELMKAGLSI